MHMSIQSRVQISALTRRYGVSPRAIRFYEEEGLIKAARDRQNRRIYDAEAQARLAQIVDLRRCGLSIPEIREGLELQDSGAPPENNLDYVLRRLRNRRSQVSAELEALDRQIETLARDDRQLRARHVV